MKIEFQRKPHWSAGSYVDLVLAALSMQILFFVLAAWIATSGEDFYLDNLRDAQYVMRIQLGLGWLMCILAGISFSILPLIYDVEGFERTLMRIYVGMNVSGQLSITGGLLSENDSLFYSLSTIGITLLCASLVCLGPPSMTIFRNKPEKGSKVGPFSYALGAFLPALGIITLSCWILREEFPNILKLSEAIVFDLFFSLALVAIIISHINRRLDWEIIKPENTGKVFAVYSSLLLLSIAAKPLQDGGDISLRLSAVLQLIPYLFIFVMLNPVKILKNIRAKKPFKTMVVTSVFWLPVVGIAAYLETMKHVETSEEMMSYYSLILIFGVAFQVLWGFTAYLHQDHKKKSIHSRKTHWYAYSSINIGVLIVVYAMFSSWQTGKSLDSLPDIAIVIIAVAYISILVYWMKEIFFCLYTWHKIPMFYDQYLANPERGSGFFEEN